MKHITIIGGTDGFGKWLTKFLLKNFPNFHITVTGLADEKLQLAEKELGVQAISDNKLAVLEADVVIFSVPIALTEKIILEVAPFIPKKAIAMDVTSIKSIPSKALKKAVQEGVLVIPTHPMFGPYVASIEGQIIVLTPEENAKCDTRYKFIKTFLESKGAKVIESSPKEHDRMMAVVQGLTHFDMFVLGETIKRLKIDIAHSMNFVSPIYKLMISSVARYVGQNPKLYADIQMYNSEVLEVHEIFMQVTSEFNNFVKNADEDGFIKTINQTKKYFGKQTDIGQAYTDKIIYLISQQEEKFKDYIGKKISIKNIYTNELHSGKLTSLQDNHITLDNIEYPLHSYIIL